MDLDEALKWYHKAADQNYAPAQCDLGGCYEFGMRDRKTGRVLVDNDWSRRGGGIVKPLSRITPLLNTTSAICISVA